MDLKSYIKGYSTYVGIILIQVTLIGAGLVFLGFNDKKDAVMTYTAPTKEITEALESSPQAQPQVTGTSTEREPKIININIASQKELETLSGVGEVTSLKIIDYRNQSPFGSIEDIMDVSGIGEKKFQKIKDFITI